MVTNINKHIYLIMLGTEPFLSLITCDYKMGWNIARQWEEIHTLGFTCTSKTEQNHNSEILQRSPLSNDSL